MFLQHVTVGLNRDEFRTPWLTAFSSANRYAFRIKPGTGFRPRVL
jgi:hypothetical protein